MVYAILVSVSLETELLGDRALARGPIITLIHQSIPFILLKLSDIVA